MDNLRQPITTFCIGGGGSHLTRNSVAFNYINDTLSGYGITPHNIHGVTTDATGLRVRSPSEQYEEIMDNMSDRTKEKGEEGSVLLIAQCMGTIAAHRALLSITEEGIDAALVAFSPPLPNPDQVIQLPSSRKRRRNNDTEMKYFVFLEMGDFNTLCYEWIPLPRGYFHDIQKAHDLEKRLHQSIEIGHAAVIAAENDWNTGTPSTVSSWKRDWQLRGLHEAKQRAIVIPKIGHSLNPSGENNHPAPLSQQQACRLVVDTGLKILNADPLSKES